MNAISGKRAGRGALALSALAGVLLAALLGVSAEPALGRLHGASEGGNTDDRRRRGERQARSAAPAWLTHHAPNRRGCGRHG
jgi:hypothetical protein